MSEDKDIPDFPIVLPEGISAPPANVLENMYRLTRSLVAAVARVTKDCELTETVNCLVVSAYILGGLDATESLKLQDARLAKEKVQ